MKNLDTCNQMERASAYYDGELTGSRLADFEAHLAECPACQAELASLRALSGQWQAMRTPAVPAEVAAKLRERLEAQEEKGLLHAAEACM